MNKFLDWCNLKRKPISYSIGGMNLLAGVSSLLTGNYVLAVVGFIIGASLVFDGYRGYK